MVPLVIVLLVCVTFYIRIPVVPQTFLPDSVDIS